MGRWLERLEEKQGAEIAVHFDASGQDQKSWGSHGHIDITLIRLSEFERRDIAVEIYSEVLDVNLWLCSNDKIAAQIRKDAPEQVCYTADELRHLLNLNPSSRGLIKIHEVKNIFDGHLIKGERQEHD